MKKLFLLPVFAIAFFTTVPHNALADTQACSPSIVCPSGQVCNQSGACEAAQSCSGANADDQCPGQETCNTSIGMCMGAYSGIPTGATTQTTNANSSSGATIVNPLNVSTLQDLLGKVLDAVVYLGGIVLTLALIWCGFLFVAARGNEEKISSARKALMWTIIGGLILLGAKGIQTVITQTVTGLTS